VARQLPDVREVGGAAIEASGPSRLGWGAEAGGSPRTPKVEPRAGRTAMWLLLLACVTVPGDVMAGISLTLHSVSGSRPVSGAGTTNASLSFGTVSAFGPLAAGIDRVSTSSTYTISTDVGVRVTRDLLSILSTSYTLRARLQSTHPLTWRVGGVTMSTSYTTIVSGQPYESTVPRTIAVVVPFSRTAGSISAQLEVLAIAN
jgi:hypothetical protein